MAPPSQLNIATSSINRLLKEESSYRTELSNQEKRVEKLKGGGGDSEEAGNREFQLRQEVGLSTHLLMLLFQILYIYCLNRKTFSLFF